MSEEVRYSPGEETANAITHAIGSILSIYGLVMLVYYSKTPEQTAAVSVFGAMMFLLFQSSTLYHAIVDEKAKLIFRKIDHSAIYLLIAGTYTPILLSVMPFPHSIAVLSVIWYLAISGIIFSCITLKFKYISTGLYLIMGWLAILLFYQIWKTSAQSAVWLLLSGGIAYSVGSVFYLLKYKYFHAIWHLFVLAGAILHYFAILELLKV